MLKIYIYEILYVKDESSAIDFNKENKKNIVFAKYFSPTCPACKVMEPEWDELCKDIDEKYNTDLILAQINSSRDGTFGKYEYLQ